MGANAYQDRHLALLTGGDDIFGYPETHQGWAERQQVLLDLAHGGDYTGPRLTGAKGGRAYDLVKSQQLFREFDDDGKVIGVTRAYYADRLFVLSVATAALSLTRVTLNKASEDVTDEDAEKAQEIWKRSAPGNDWTLLLAATGDLHVEACRADTDSDLVTLIAYPPHNVIPVYGMVHRNRLERVTITTMVQDDPVVDFYGNVTLEGALYRHQRKVDRDEIQVTAEYPDDKDGERQKTIDEKASGPHRVGTCPVVHIKCLPSGHPEHGLPVTHGMDRPLMLIDSLTSQIKAVGDRYANPAPYLLGAQLSEDNAWGRIGRWFNAWGKGADKVTMGYLEPSMDGIKALSEQLRQLIDDTRSSMPEYLFNLSTANLSAEALRLLSGQFEAKYLGIRGELYRGLERALAIGVAMEQRRPYDPNNHPVTITGPDLLPGDILQDLEALARAKDLGGITRQDIIGHTQRLGLADQEIEATDYAELVAEEEMGSAAALSGDDDDTTGTEVEEPAEETSEASDGSEPLAATALNGAQVTGLLAILASISEGKLTEEAAVVLMTNAFPTLDQAEARRIAAGAIPVEEPEATPPGNRPPPPMNEAPPEDDAKNVDDEDLDT